MFLFVVFLEGLFMVHFIAQQYNNSNNNNNILEAVNYDYTRQRYLF